MSARAFVLALGALACTSSASLRAQSVLHTFVGDAAGDALGISVSGVGDIDGDGRADLIVGAYTADVGGEDSGLARVYSGSDGSVLYTVPGDSPADELGFSVAGVGDIDGDGMPDFFVGARWDDTFGIDAGSARVYSGATGALIHFFQGDASADRFGYSVAGAGDIDLDGVPDLVVGARLADVSGPNSGLARVFSGASGLPLFTFAGDSAFDEFGHSVAGAGDVNGDGRADVIVGARRDDNNGVDSGSARVFSGADGTILYTFDGDSAGDRLGNSVAGAGDVNGDGYADLLGGARWDDDNGTNCGSMRLYSGAHGADLATWYGDSAGDELGISVAGAGDVDGDGVPDVMAGIWFSDVTGGEAGSARVYSGATGVALATLHGDAPGDEFGIVVSGPGDVDGDGTADLFVGARGADSNGVDAGLARAFRSDLSPWERLPGGTVGIDGEPLLVMTGSLLPASFLALDLTQAAPQALAAIFISFSSTPVAFLGGTLHAFPVGELVVVGTDATGSVGGAAFFPGAGSGVQLWFQVGVVDATVPLYGASLSDAWVGTVP